MGNMSYCRFENTSIDLEDCHDHFDENDLSEGERAARRRIIKMAVEIALDYGGEIDREVIEE